MPHLKAINGSENTLNLSETEIALINFYNAFNNQQLEKMKDNWLQTPEASMSNPLGDVKHGWHEIENVYQKIFNGPAEVFVEFYDFDIQESESMFCAIGRERGFLKSNNQEISLAIRTSRFFKKVNNQWKQIHHHGSIDQPELLAKYQSAVLQK